MRFKYQARTKEGLIQIGIVEAPSQQRAASLLQERGLYITYLEAEEKKPFYARELGIFTRPTKKDVLYFARHLALMLKSGIGLVEALRSIALQTEKARFREIVLKIADDVEGGTYFSDALSKFPGVFSDFFVNMIKSGEASGKLADSLTYLADNLEKEYLLLTKVKSGMTYPAFILIVFVLVGLIMFFVVLPRFAEAVENLNIPLPAVTRAIISVGVFLQSWWWLILITLLFIIFGIWRYLRTKEGKELLSNLSLKLPIIGKIAKKIYITRFCENLATLIFAGLPITQALEVVSGVITNKRYKNIVIEAKEGVRRGETISVVLEKYPKSIPSMVVQMVRVGEKSGRLDEALKKVAEFYRVEIDSAIEGLVSIIEPIMIIILGTVVGGLMLGIFLPIYKNIGTFGF
ncbi:type II secretion system F family protein [bacterium]|nr:type II secretion system F family protein [bacterium]